MKKVFLVLLVLIFIVGCDVVSPVETFIVTFEVEEGGFVYKEIVTEVLVDNIKQGTSGRYYLELEEGEHTVVWSYANVNGYGHYLNEKTKSKKFMIFTSGKKIKIKGSMMYFTK